MFEFQKEQNKGVSPVIAVILMVAITIILSAVIGTYMLGLTDSLSKNASASVTFEETDGEKVTVQLNNIQEADKIYINVSDIEDEATETYDSNNNGSDDALTIQGGVTNDSGDGEYYLLNRNDGGPGTIITIHTQDKDLDGGQISVIGVIGGESNVIQTHDYSS